MFLVWLAHYINSEADTNKLTIYIHIYEYYLIPLCVDSNLKTSETLTY